MTDSVAPRRLAGRCFCGDAAYAVDDAFEYALNCHCSNCRRTTGAAYKPFAGIAIERLAPPDAARLLRFGEGGGADLHCARCGSLLYSIVREGRYAHVTLGTLVDTPSIRPSAHIFVGSKAPWHEITDTLPQFDGHVGA